MRFSQSDENNQSETKFEQNGRSSRNEERGNMYSLRDNKQRIRITHIHGMQYKRVTIIPSKKLT